MRAWLHALRIWAALVLALWLAFWLQLDGPASAATPVAILSLQTRGQAYKKAFYRLFGTAVGIAASFAIVALLPQARDLYVVAFVGWIALSVFVAGFLD